MSKGFDSFSHVRQLPGTAGGGRLRLEGLTDVEETLRLSTLTGNRPLWLNADNDVEAIESSEFVSLLGLDDKADKCLARNWKVLEDFECRIQFFALGFLVVESDTLTL